MYSNPSSVRFLVAHLPSFRLERCGWQKHHAVALVNSEKQALRVQCVTPAARRLGVMPGMTAAEACALVPSLHTENLQHEEEWSDLEELTEQLLRISPCVAPLPPDSLVSTLSAANPHRAGHERAIIERVRIRLEHLGHQARVVIADDPVTALACATWGKGNQIVPSNHSAQALAPLPIAALQLPVREQALLQGLGIHTVGAFADLPAAAVAGRLGPVAVAAHTLAQGRHYAPPIPPHVDEGALIITQDLPDPVVQLDALIFVINAILQDACVHLATTNQATHELQIRFHLEEGGTQELCCRLGTPSRSSLKILPLLRLRLERFQLSGPVTGISLEVSDPSPYLGRQHDLLQRHRTHEAVAQVAARLQDDLGSHAVFTPQLSDRHRPESAWLPTHHHTNLSSAMPTTTPVHPPSAQLSLTTSAIPSDPVAEWCGSPHPTPPNRPPILLTQPTAIGTEISPRIPAGGLPLNLHMDGRRTSIVAAQGPERIEGEWWSNGFQREYWLVTLSDQRRAWIYREDNRWALHGWWDR